MIKSKSFAVILTAALVTGVFAPAAQSEAASVKLNKTKLSLVKGKSTILKVKRAKKKAVWTISSGKKVIKLSAKKKASVKVKALKAGKAKVSCKVGKKKLICKVTVTAKQKENAEPTVTPTVVPTQSPAVTPSQTPSTMPSQTPATTPTASPAVTPSATPVDMNAYELKTINTPGPAAEYDCLKVETGLHKSYLTLGHFMPGGSMEEEMQFFETGIWREDIEQITISKSKEVPEGVLGKFDLSEKQNGSVMAWYTDQDADGEYEMTIGQDGGVVANPNSTYLFCQIKNNEKKENGGEAFLQGIENLDTSHVVDMSHMFEYSQDLREQLNLGDSFDTSSVKDISHMFSWFGYARLRELNLGDKFTVSSIENMKSAFYYTGAGDLKCIVKDADTKAWFDKNARSMSWHVGILAGWEFNPDSLNDIVVAEKK